MVNNLKINLTSLRPLESALLINAIGISFMKFIPYSILLLFFAWLYEVLVLKSIEFNFKKLILTRNFLILTTPFWMSVFGLLYTSNLAKGFEDLGRIIPFLIFPILLMGILSDRIETLNKLVLASFIIGLLIRFSIDFNDSFIGYTCDYNIQNFFYSYLDSDTNILSVITLFGVFFMLDYLNEGTFNSKRTFVFQFLIFFLSLCILMLQSRIVIMFFFLSLFFLFIYNLKRKNKWNILATIIFSGMMMSLPPFQGRFQVAAVESQKLIKNNKIEEKSNENRENLTCMSSTELRYNSLKASWKIIKRHPILGVGTGDWRDELVSEYRLSNMPCNALEKTAPHNQYMRTLLKFGFLGLLVYVIYLILLLHIHRCKRKLGQIPFLITLVLCGLGYDLMDVGSSAPFFAFFSTWLFFDKIR